MDISNLDVFGKNILDFYKTLDEQNESKLPSNIRHCFLSVFDKWLDNEECEKLCHTFSTLKAHINDPIYEDKWILYYSYEEKFKRYYRSLFQYEVYKVIGYKPEEGSHLERLTDINSYEDYFISNIRENTKNFSLFLVKDLNLAINGGFDHTHELFISSECDNKKLEKMVAESGLFIIS